MLYADSVVYLLFSGQPLQYLNIIYQYYNKWNKIISLRWHSKVLAVTKCFWLGETFCSNCLQFTKPFMINIVNYIEQIFSRENNKCSFPVHVLLVVFNFGGGKQLNKSSKTIFLKSSTLSTWWSLLSWCPFCNNIFTVKAMKKYTLVIDSTKNIDSLETWPSKYLACGLVPMC